MKQIVRVVLDVCGETYAEEAGIRLRDSPSSLYQLMVLSLLLSTRIRGQVAVAASREFTEAGIRTPKRMMEASWQDRVDILGRAHYVRYDESTSTALGEGAQLLIDSYGGDIRRMRSDDLRSHLQEFPRIGPVGADIFCREAQAIWPELRPYFDAKALAGAKRLSLPNTAEALGDLVPGDENASLAAALVRVSLDTTLVKRVHELCA